MDACKVNARSAQAKESFEDIYEAMGEDRYWIRFFVRPCCPAPGLDGAIEMLDKLKAELDERPDFSEDQKAQIAEVIEQRKEWYPSSGLCRGARS